MTADRTDQAYQAALTILRNCSCPAGFKASADAGGYQEVWARDSLMTTLAVAQLGDAALIATAKQSLRTLADHQTAAGMLPNNVDSVSHEADYQACVDGTLWYSIALAAMVQQTDDQELLQTFYPTVERAFVWLACQDVDASGLISTQEAGDWQDQLPVRGKVLTDNVLYVKALRSAALLAERMQAVQQQQHYLAKATQVQAMIQRYFWLYDAQPHTTAQIHNPTSKEYATLFAAENATYLGQQPYFVAWRGFHQVGSWFDTLGNMLAIVTGVATEQQTKQILEYAAAVHIAEPYPAQAIYPAIEPSDPNWREYMRKGNLNLPHQYHNGGIWPFIGGWSVLALVQAGRVAEAQQQLAVLAEVNALGRSGSWEFNEWLHGTTGEPMGKPHQAWSAALYCLAYQAVRDIL
ncbi:MAG: glycogen debranching protein [Candidatus Kerfeldbacteria bacterium]|nr:glycogen debranching protein [Candidatus Kerfeldbacteria bacterium]